MYFKNIIANYSRRSERALQGATRGRDVIRIGAPGKTSGCGFTPSNKQDKVQEALEQRPDLFEKQEGKDIGRPKASEVYRLLPQDEAPA